MQDMFNGLGFTVFRMRLKQVRHMQKTSTLQPDVDKGTLHSWKDPYHSPQKNIANKTFGILAFNQEIAHGSVIEQCNSYFTKSTLN